MATVLITGGTGLVGTRLAEMLLAKGYAVIILTRNASEVKHKMNGVAYANWDITKQTIDRDAIAHAGHIIHLAGAGVADKRWSQKRKQEIIESRTRSSALIVKALAEIENQVATVVSASAIGWYGADTETGKQNGFTENTPADNQFLGKTCRLWEESIAPVEQLGKRLVILRTGIVLSKKGGALSEFKKPLKAFVTAILGDGKQVISWIHINDLCSLYMYALENKELHGAYNAVSPKPVTNKTLMIELGKEMHGKTFIPIHVPSFLLKIALGEMSIEVLKSATVSSSKIEAAGFQFQYPDILKALPSLTN